MLAPVHLVSPAGHDRWRLPLAGLLGVAGVAHFVTPGPFEGIIPPHLGSPAAWVAVSGIAEISCAAGLLAPSWTVRRRAALLTAALLVAVYPGNLYMAWSAFTDDGSAAYRAGTLARLPLQVPLVLGALSVARAARRQRE